MLETREGFGVRKFGQADLGDSRRTKRLVELADQLVARPGGLLPQKLNNPSTLKAAYRLFASDSVTHSAILQPHRQDLFRNVLAAREGFTLVLHDSTELEYTKRESLTDLGMIGNGSRRGFIGHNSLLVCPESGKTLGLANQILHRREARPEKRNSVASVKTVKVDYGFVVPLPCPVIANWLMSAIEVPIRRSLSSLRCVVDGRS